MEKTQEALRSNFTAALATLASGNVCEGQSDLFRAYHRLLFSVPKGHTQRDAVLRFMLFSLLERLDEAEGEVAEVLYLYTFRDFLENFGSEPAVQAAISEYLDTRTLCKPSLQIALGMRRRK